MYYIFRSTYTQQQEDKGHILKKSKEENVGWFGEKGGNDVDVL